MWNGKAVAIAVCVMRILRLCYLFNWAYQMGLFYLDVTTLFLLFWLFLGFGGLAHAFLFNIFNLFIIFEFMILIIYFKNRKLLCISNII